MWEHVVPMCQFLLFPNADSLPPPGTYCSLPHLCIPPAPVPTRHTPHPVGVDFTPPARAYCTIMLSVFRRPTRTALAGSLRSVAAVAQQLPLSHGPFAPCLLRPATRTLASSAGPTTTFTGDTGVSSGHTPVGVPGGSPPFGSGGKSTAAPQWRHVRNPYAPSRVATNPQLKPRSADDYTAFTTQVNGPLSCEEREHFGLHGFLVLQSAFKADEVEAVAASAQRLHDFYASLPLEQLDAAMDMAVVTEAHTGGADGMQEQHPIKTIFRPHVGDAPHLRAEGPLLQRVCHDARLVNVARQLLGEDVYVHQSRINFQGGATTDNPAGGGGFLWHQDFEVWHSEDGMPRPRALSMALLLDHNHATNGALMVVPGSHSTLLQPFVPDQDPHSPRYHAKGANAPLRGGPQLDFTLFGKAVADSTDAAGIVQLTGRPGDVVVFDSMLLHGSHTNITPWKRRNVFVAFNACSNVVGSPYAGTPARPAQFAERDPARVGVPISPEGEGTDVLGNRLAP